MNGWSLAGRHSGSPAAEKITALFFTLGYRLAERTAPQQANRPVILALRAIPAPA